MRVRNLTPHAHAEAILYEPAGHEVLVVVVKASFRLGSAGAETHPSPLPIARTDQPAAPGGLLYPGEMMPTRGGGTDVICIGFAHAPGGEPAPSFDAELRVGEVGVRVRVFGPRRWTRRDGTLVPSDPEPVARVSLGFESAFGGTLGDYLFARNPIGKGYWHEDERPTPDGVELPLLEDPDRLIEGPADLPAPVAFGAVAPSWQPRLARAGTYDETWTSTRAPLLPNDFDDRFFQVAAPGLTTAKPLLGGETVELVHLAASGRIVTKVPRVHVRLKVGATWLRPDLDQIVIEPEEDRIALTYRATIDVTGRLYRLPSVLILEKKLRPLGGA
jgi:hypothetical protein